MYTNTNNRLWVLGAVIVAVAVLAMGWFLGVSPKLDEASAADQQSATIDTNNASQQQRLAKTQAQFKQLPELKAKLATLRAAVPADDELSSFLGELHALEQANGVVLASFVASNAQPYVPVKKDTGANIAGITNPLITPNNFVAIPVVVTVSGAQPNVMGFIGGLQSGARLFLVTTFTLAQDPSKGDFTGTITGYVYVLLDTPAVAAKTPGAAPAKTAEAAPAAKG